MYRMPDLTTCKKIGFIVPSSNTAVEPITNAIVSSLNRNIICLFTRIQVKTVGTDAQSASQFSTETFVNAACLLADANVDVIVWSGTSGMWLGGGLEADQSLVQAMQEATGIPCSTTTIATIEALNYFDMDYIALATPYDAATTARVKDFYSSSNFEVLRTERLKETPESNIDIATSSVEEMQKVIRRAKTAWTQAIVVPCTNWPASVLVEDLETELDVVILDSIIVTVWWALRMVGFKQRVSGWGQLMYETPARNFVLGKF